MDTTKQHKKVAAEGRQRYDRQRIYVGDAVELWECQRQVSGKSHPNFAAHLLVLHTASCNECAPDVSETDRSVT